MRVGKFFRALAIAIFGFLRRQPFFTLAVAVYVLPVGFFMIHDLFETPQERQTRLQAENVAARAQRAQEAQDDSVRAAQHERNKIFCKLRDVCEQFGNDRQECATAGNFENCLRVKMGDDNYDLRGSCTDDGKIVDEHEAPNKAECFVLGLGK
jgi:hypothetical protein